MTEPLGMLTTLIPVGGLTVIGSWVAGQMKKAAPKRLEVTPDSTPGTRLPLVHRVSTCTVTTPFGLMSVHASIPRLCEARASGAATSRATTQARNPMLREKRTLASSPTPEDVIRPPWRCRQRALISNGGCFERFQRELCPVYAH